MLMAIDGLFKHDLVEWMTAHDLPGGLAARARRTCASCCSRWARCTSPRKGLLDDPALGDPRHRPRGGGHPARRALPDRAFRRAARRQPAALDRQGPGQRPEPRGVEGRTPRPTRSSGATATAAPIPWTAFACASAPCAATARRSRSSSGATCRWPRSRACSPGGNDWVQSGPQPPRRDARAAHAGRGDRDARSSRRPPAQARRWAASTLRRSPWATSCCGARPSRCAGCCESFKIPGAWTLRPRDDSRENA